MSTTLDVQTFFFLVLGAVFEGADALHNRMRFCTVHRKKMVFASLLDRVNTRVPEDARAQNSVNLQLPHARYF